MTNGWIDIKNTDMMLIMGGNPAENHPCGFKWPIEAKLHRNAKMIVVDPRFTRTAATADLFLQIRAGTDIAFLGGLINYAIENNRIAHDYLVNYTNAAFIVKEGFKLPEDGLFSGFDAATQVVRQGDLELRSRRQLVIERGRGGRDARAAAASSAAAHATAASAERCAGQSQPRNALTGLGHARADGPGQARKAGGPKARTRAAPRAPPRRRSLPPNVAYDLSLQHPRCVFQLLKQQYSRYTPEMVERITGIPKDQFLKAAELFTSVRKDGDMKKVGHDHLRGRLDAAHLRHADHPHRRDAAAAARQRRPRRRRRQRAARPLEHPGRDRHGRRLRHPARLSEDADARRRRFRDLPEAHHADAVEAAGVGLVQLLVEHAEVRGLVPEGDVRRRGDEGERLGLPLSAEDRPQVLLDARSGTTCTTASVKGLFAFGMNGVADRPELAEEHRRAEEGRLAGGRRDLSGRDQRVLEVAGHHARGDEEDPDDGLPPAVRGLRGEGRHVRQLRALAAVEERRAAAARRLRGSTRTSSRRSS